MEPDGAGANAQNDADKVRFEPTYVEGTALSPRLALPASTTMNPYSTARWPFGSRSHDSYGRTTRRPCYYGRRSDSGLRVRINFQVLLLARRGQ